MFTIEYLESVVTEDIPALPKTMRERIKSSIEKRLTADPMGLGKPLRYSFIGHRRIRVGDYRIVYRIDHKHNKVIIVLISIEKKFMKINFCEVFNVKAVHQIKNKRT